MKLSDQINLDTWVVSDTHCGHDNILKYEPSRVDAMKIKGFRSHTEWLIFQWNSVVGSDDLVLHLGDFVFRENDVLYRLNGRIVMLVGNHDVDDLDWYRDYQNQYPDKFELIEGVPEFIESHDVSGLIKEIGGKKVFFSHYPLVTADPYTKGQFKDARDKMAKLYKKQKCDLSVHGHLHSKDGCTNKRKEINVSIERTGFQSVKLQSYFDFQKNQNSSCSLGIPFGARTY